jgi:ABC-2 type transport system ATP-binding protein
MLTEISETCDRILVLKAGEIVAAGKEADLSRGMLEGMQIELTVRLGAAAGPDDVSGLARQVTGIRSVIPIEPREPGALVRSFRVDADRDVRESLSRVLVEARIGILEIVRSRRELESVFLRLTGTDSAAPLDGPRSRQRDDDGGGPGEVLS